MPQISRSAILPYSADFMYHLVNDVATYPEFLPWCGAVEIHSQSDRELEASIQMRGAGVDSWFRTRNRMTAGETIDIELVDGPFEKLEGQWRFTPLGEEGSKIELVLSFEIKRGLAAAIIKPAFSRIANTMVDSFCQRAEDLHER